MTREVDDKNSESISRPFAEKAIQLFLRNNYSDFLACFPDLGAPIDQHKFNQVAKSLNLLGDNPTVEYLDTLFKPTAQLYLWKLYRGESDKALILTVGLTENGDVFCVVVKNSNTLEEPELTESTHASKKPQLSGINAETLGTPIIEKLLNALLTHDFELYCQLLANGGHEKSSDTKEIFDEAVSVLKPMGHLISFNFLAHAKMSNYHLLMWKTQYHKDDEDLLFELMLTEVDGELNLHGWSFDR